MSYHVSARPVDPLGPEYAYLQVADDVQRRISEGRSRRSSLASGALPKSTASLTPPCGTPWPYYATAESSSRFTAEGTFRKTPGNQRRSALIYCHLHSLATIPAFRTYNHIV